MDDSMFSGRYDDQLIIHHKSIACLEVTPRRHANGQPGYWKTKVESADEKQRGVCWY